MTRLPYEASLHKKLSDKFPPNKTEIDALIGLFDESLDAASASIHYTHDIDSTQKETEVQAKLWRIWIVLQDAAAQFPEQHDKVWLHISAPFPIIVSGKSLVKWSELPILSSQWREGLFNWGMNHKLTEHINLTACTAKLSAHSLDGAPSFTAAETDLCISFEQATDDASLLDKSAIQELDSSVRVAPQWILFAGKDIYDYEEVTQSKSEGLWKGPLGFSKARWDFWKERARWAVEQQKLSKATRKVEGSLLRKMDEIAMATYS